MPTPARHWQWRGSWLCVCLLLIQMTACNFDLHGSGRAFRANMSDTSYFRGRDVERVDADGRTVRWSDFSGRFVWAEYAAPWCSICAQQSPELRNLDRPELVVVTVMTSEIEGYGHPPTSRTAAAWADRFGLNHAHVLATDLTSLSVPRHLFFSPEGHTLFAIEGFIARKRVKAIIDTRSADWQRWKQTGERAEWMR